MIIWPLFGTTNQLLAGLTLLVISVILLKAGRSIKFTFVPLCFLLVMAPWALVIQLGQFWEQRNYLLIVMDLAILGATIMVALEAASALMKARREGPGGPAGPSDRATEEAVRTP
jgi:carbon starvation protein